MAFSIAVTSPMKGAERISRSLGVYAGKVSITSYSQTLVECTAITKYFVPTSSAAFQKGLMSVQIDGPSSGGYILSWDATTGGFRAYSPTTVVFAGSATGAGVTAVSGALGSWTLAAVSKEGTYVHVATQAEANVLIGTFGFVAVGFVKG